MGRMMGGLLLLLVCAMMACPHAMGDEEVLDVNGSPIKFYATFDMIDAQTHVSYPFGFFFGGGGQGVTVRTDEEVTLGRDGNTSQIYVCRDGAMTLIDVSSTTPQDAFLRVRHNSTGDFYLIDITESSDSTLQLAYCTQEGIRCSESAGTPILFQLNSGTALLRRRQAYASLM